MDLTGGVTWLWADLDVVRGWFRTLAESYDFIYNGRRNILRRKRPLTGGDTSPVGSRLVDY